MNSYDNAWIIIHFISDIEVQSDPTTKKLYQSDPIRNEYFGSEIRTNRFWIGFAYL
jgi:hypothetical protein